MPATEGHPTNALREADRLMTICNACRYCEALCAVFPAMELRREFSAGDLNYLANLCHGCGACYYDCQYAPPHEFAVNVARSESATEPLDVNRLDQFGVHLGTQATQTEEIERLRQLRDKELEKKQSFWRWLLVATLCVLITETWLAGRTSRADPTHSP